MRVARAPGDITTHNACINRTAVPSNWPEGGQDLAIPPSRHPLATTLLSPSPTSNAYYLTLTLTDSGTI
jgi:hypothetical protein